MRLKSKMAYLNLFRDQLYHNTVLDKLFKSKNIKWGITTKLLCGIGLPGRGDRPGNRRVYDSGFPT